MNWHDQVETLDVLSKNNKAPNTDGLRTEFYTHFYRKQNEIKNTSVPPHLWTALISELLKLKNK